LEKKRRVGDVSLTIDVGLFVSENAIDNDRNSRGTMKRNNTKPKQTQKILSTKTSNRSEENQQAFLVLSNEKNYRKYNKTDGKEMLRQRSRILR
jgi:hypothetical protein